MTTSSSSAPRPRPSIRPGAPHRESDRAAPPPGPGPAERPAPGLGTARLLATLSALLVSVVGFAAAGIAVPDIGASLGATAGEQSLVVSVYALGFAVPMVLGGRLGDLYGRRRLFLLGMAGFTLFSLVSALAPGITVLIGARALAGISAAAMVPQVLATITASTQGPERARAVALFGATAGGATAIGQVLGGVLLSVPLLGAPWRSVFAMSVLMGALAFVAALRRLPDTRASGHRSLDLTGTSLLGFALLALMVPVSQGGALGWPVWCWALLGASPVLFAVFWRWQVRLHRSDRVPLVPPPLFRLGVGQAFMFGPLVGAMIAEVPPAAAGAASGVLQTTQQAAMGLGVAVAGGLLGAALASSAAPTAQDYTGALAVCMLVQAAFALVFAVCALALPRR
ncbi:MFS transporter [Streptomyces carpaticus]|uniref:MFS transporter n=1 Tax=Streptomyces carpaticus TaxID=285558 RepID=UPI0031F8352B